MKAGSEALHYTIVPRCPAAHRFEVTLSIDDPDPDGQLLRLPVWVPGSYLIREFARHVVSIAAHAGDESVALEKIDKHTWRCAPCTGVLRVTCDIYAWDLSVRAAHLDSTHAYFNGSSVFLAVVGREHEPCTVDIEPPRGEAYRRWRVATSLERAGAPEFGFGRYRASDYDALIDHPVECGTFDLVSFDAHGVRHDIAVTGRHQGDLARLAADFARVCTQHIDLFGAPPPFDYYLFQITVVGEGYGGLEHRSSTSLLCSRNDLPQPGRRQGGEKYRTLLGLASHEYFHAWQVKRIKPAAFQPYDLSTEAYTRQLWAFEGITSYYDDLALVRCGLISADEYLVLLGETMTRVLRGSGRFRQSVAESSFDAWIKFYRQDENSPNAVVSYYAKGSLVALALDLMLREATAGKRSLDDLMRTLWQEYGAREVGVPEGRIEALASMLAERDLSRFFATAVHGTEDLALAPLLETIGVSLRLRAAANEADKGGSAGAPTQPDDPPRAWLGARVGTDGRIAVVHDASPAQRAGLSSGDQLLALDGIRWSGTVESMLAAAAPGREIALHAFRRDELFEGRILLDDVPHDTAWCAFDDKADDAATDRRRAWLAGVPRACVP
ncbi:MAG: M61 family metallopeptidase [Proteobacteria bacterium]|nr:M61 family metallopeptidase [Burkholderiales bacterium]